ncbi:hypothetical protein JY651_21165 [Pyxidicoccus parkwayensis]|uniref:Platelet-activating factor acetylhydrolase plasma/intracellular n=1 Tax=Pyxidicoccus parkwayensis TaxID=2813578 RepID=A0ABX7P9Y4_9BACT|nr:hypothetical protein [Pyxidicoccus parkwaysis]QSQ27269.1 hypothetical protein JY651_21165 [Pyxidicoccus parkwaysis]
MSRRRHIEGISTALVLACGLLTGTGCDGDDSKPPDDSPSLPTHTRVDNASLDVLPGVYPNAVDLSGTGTFEVAVLGAEGLDVSDLDPAQATLWDAKEEKKVSAVGTAPSRDVDGDGRLDALFTFSLPALKQAGVLTAETGRVVFRGKTRGGTEVSAQDGLFDAQHLVTRLPEPTGSFAVGTLEYAWTDGSREEWLTTEAGDFREVKVRLWYPAITRPQAQPAPYFLQPLEGELFATQGGLSSQVFSFVLAHSVRGAALPEGSERFPVVLLSHGYGSATALSSVAAEELASHGYVVAAISHPHSSSALVFPDGRVVSDVVEISPAQPDLNRRVQDLWTADARFVLDQLTRLDTADAQGRFTGRLDLTRVGMFGHSFGGSTAGEACRTDARVKAGLNMDGTFFGNLDAEVRVPFLLMNSEEATVDPSRARFFEHLRAIGYDVSFEGAGHFSFTDLGLALPLLQHYAPRTDAEDYQLGTLDAARAPMLVKAYVLAFFDKHLRELPAPLLDGPSAQNPEVELVLHAP